MGRVSFTELRKEKAIDTLKDERANILMRLFDKIGGKDIDSKIMFRRRRVEAVSFSDKPPAQCNRIGQYYLPFIKTVLANIICLL